MQEGENNRSCQVEYLETPVKLENDKKEYRAIRLPNGLEALLISDEISKTSFFQHQAMKNEMKKEIYDEFSKSEENIFRLINGLEILLISNAQAETCTSYSQDKNDEKKATCGLSVGVGTFSDPPEIPGIAIFFDYMLFKGIDQHSQKCNFQTFIENYGGCSNTIVDYEHTTFHFDIQEKILFQALCHLAQFCFKPLWNIDAFIHKSTELKEEFQRALNFIKHREDRLLSSFAETGHPANKFTMDHLVKLQNNKNINIKKLYEVLQKFAKRHYSAHRMKLVIQSGIPLNTLEDFILTSTYFKDVPTNWLPPDDFSKFKNNLFFATPAFRKMYKVNVPLKDREVFITWVIPPLLHLYKSKPHKYIFQIIQHEGQGSLISYLRKNMWSCINSMNTLQCKIKYYSTHSLIKLIVNLSCKGQQHLKKVLDAIFSFINLIKKEGPQKRFYDEFCKSEQMSFRFVDEENPVNYVKNLCIKMHLYPSCHYLTGNKLYFEYNPEDIQKCLNYLVPETANIMLFDENFADLELNEVEQWSNTKYTDIEIPKEWIKHWKSIKPLREFYLPYPNPFLPKDFTSIVVSTKVSKYLVKLYSNRISEVWYRADTKLSKCYFNLHLVSPLILQSSKYAVLMDMYCKILKFLLTDQLYPATTVGIDYKIIATEKGFVIKIYGFSEKIPLLLDIIAQHIRVYPTVTKNLFKTLKKHQIETYYNTFSKSWNLVEDMRLWILKYIHYTYLDKYAALYTTYFEDLQSFVHYFTKHLYVQCLVQGNMTKNTAYNTVWKFLRIIDCKPLYPNMMPDIRINQIKLDTTCWMSKSYKRLDFGEFPSPSVVRCYYQVGVMSIKLSLIIELIALIMKVPLFEKLMQEFGKQLDSTECFLKNDNGILGLYIVADIYTSKYLKTMQAEQYIDEFLELFNKILEGMSEEDLDRIKEKRKSSKPRTSYADNNLEREFERNWNEIMECKYMFDRCEKEELALKEIKINDLKECFAKYILDKSNIRKLSLHVTENDSEDVGEKNELQVTPKSYKNKMEQLFSSFALVDHPANKFPKDSFMTLYHSICDNILFEEIVKFRARHYSAHRITFVVQANLPLDTLENNVTKFSAEENNKEFDIMDKLMDLSRNMHFYPSRNYIIGSKLYFEYNTADIQKCLNYLTPETVNIILFYYNDCLKVGQWSEAEYTKIQISRECIEHWKSIKPLPNFHLPLLNIFLPSDFSLISIPAKVSKYPVKLFSKSTLELWYRPYSKICLPKCYMYFHFISSLGFLSLKNAVLMDMYCDILSFLLAEELYPAKAAGIDCEIGVTEKGITIKMYGFNEKMPLLLKIIAEYMAVHYLSSITEDLFEMIKIQRLMMYYNIFTNPVKLVSQVKLTILKLVHYSDVDKYAALLQINFKIFKDFVKSFTEHLYIQCLIQGNMTEDAAIGNVRQFLQTFKPNPLINNTLLQMRVTQIPLGTNYCKLEITNKSDSKLVVVTNYYQADVTSIKLSVLIELIIYMMEDLLHIVLDDENYLEFEYVICEIENVNGILGYFITICTQTDKYTIEYVDQSIEKCLTSFKNILNEISEEEFDNYKESIKKNWDTHDVNHEVARNWNEITKFEYMFDRFEKKKLALENIKVDEIRKWFEEHTLNGKSFRKLSIQMADTASQKKEDDKASSE
ncbi:Nardilysin [Trachymyrmex septentrionalis]|uniref:Nardilysin n=1 Tax=Trachymyrmex septentrionalis TaxID=34720 RepID=A0A195F045_9HYME|nr:Nardilysin [Trachymyrmex septentrionalis]